MNENENETTSGTTSKYEGMFDDMTIPEIAATMVSVRAELDEAKQKATDLQNLYDHIRIKVLPNKMEDFGTTTMKITGVGRLTITADIYAGIVPGKTELAYNWLDENGHADLIKDYVHPSTLKAFLKEQLKAGEILPDDLFKITPFDRASITKS